MARLFLFSALVASLISTIQADIDAEIVDLSLRAMQLVEALQEKDTFDLRDATLYKDGSNAALLFKEEGYCFAIYDATDPLSIADWAKNIDTATAMVCSRSDEENCCTARRGYQRAYSKPDYRDELDSAIIKCRNDGYKVILAGHSAGGATATVAAVALQSVEPTVLSFGQPASFVGDCSLINEETYFHWVNTAVNGDVSHNLDYDPVPFLTLTYGAKQVGQFLVMGDDRKNLVRYKYGDIPSMMSWGIDVGAHISARYIDRLKAYQKGLDLKTGGWSTGYDCNVDSECTSRNCGEESPKYWSSGKCQV